MPSGGNERTQRKISVSADGPWSLRIAAKLGDRLETLQLTPKAAISRLALRGALSMQNGVERGTSRRETVACAIAMG